MGLFGTILEKLGFGGSEAAPASAPAPVSPPAPSVTASRVDTPVHSSLPTPIKFVDVVGQLEKRAAGNTQKLNWRTSIVDLMKLLDMDSSFASRKDLAVELGCPASEMGDSAKMNIWLHRMVIAKIAANGGNIPKDLLD